MSITIMGLTVGVIVSIIKGAGIEVGTDQITDFITTGGLLVSGVMVYWGRIRKGDLNFFGGRKKVA